METQLATGPNPEAIKKLMMSEAEKLWKRLTTSALREIKLEGRDFLRLHKRGMTREEILDQIGVDPETLRLWAQDVKESPNPTLNKAQYKYRFLYRILVWRQFCKQARKKSRRKSNGKVV